jgi:hypothetical protein
MDGSEVRRIHEALGQAMGREVLQLDLGVMLGLNLASVEVGKWETEGARGPEAVALSYLSQGLPGCRGDIPEWSYQQAFHAKAVRGLQILTRYWWPRFVARIGQHGGHGCIETVSWVDEPCDTPRGFSRLRGRPSCLNRPLRRGPTPHRHRRAQGRNKKASAAATATRSSRGLRRAEVAGRAADSRGASG